ncbi:hypothetical protein LIER_41675 [Lithospermum erythrorhizon]|uniref:Uncharacterized protein n=1 Tax=Lithospermum erythrorhizon TaxID=34254 RepID=A0AAV3RCZ9_LITER
MSVVGYWRKRSVPIVRDCFALSAINIQWHAGFKCGETRDQNDDAFGVLAEKMGWVRCPRCFHFVERISGCDDAIRCKYNRVLG